jgi:DNA polymerase-1
MLVFDFETYLIQPGLLAPRLVCGAVSWDGEPELLFDADSAADVLEAGMAHEELLVGHNVAFDLGVLCAHRPSAIPAVFEHYRKGLVRDTKIRQQLIDIAAGCHNFPRADGTKGYSLADLGKHYLGKDRSKEKKDENGWRMRYSELDGVPIGMWPREAARYALEDVEDTGAVFKAQPAQVANEIEATREAWALHLMSTWGMRTEESEVIKLKALLEKEQAANFEILRAEGLYKLAGTKKAPKWTKDMAAIRERVIRAYAINGQQPPETDSGKTSTDKDTLLRSGDETLKVLADGGGVDKILTTYIPVLEQGTKVPVNARFNPLVNSYRTSCSEPNLQNLPTGRRVGGVRDCFIPRPGYYFVSVDYETLELRALAQVCLKLFGYSQMAGALREGRDLHLDMAAQMSDISYEDAKILYAAKDPGIKKARDCAKVANFGFPGGMGAESLVEFARASYKVELTVDDARELKEAFIESWPEMSDYFAHVSSLVGFGDATLVSFGNGMVRGGVGYCDGCNHFFQNLAAQGAKAALFDVARECYTDADSALFGTRPVAFIHDEIVAEVPVEKAHEAAMRLSKVMCDTMSRFIPDVPITAKPALMKRWLKNAEDVYDPNGRLIPWEPK